MVSFGGIKTMHVARSPAMEKLLVVVQIKRIEIEALTFSYLLNSQHLPT
jgi:hypothetical protein